MIYKRITQTPNILYDELLSQKSISNSMLRILLVIIRQTYGWHKNKDRISHSQMMRKSGIKSRHTVIDSIRMLEDKGLINIIDYHDKPIPRSRRAGRSDLYYRAFPKTCVILDPNLSSSRQNPVQEVTYNKKFFSKTTNKRNEPVQKIPRLQNKERYQELLMLTDYDKNR